MRGKKELGILLRLKKSKGSPYLNDVQDQIGTGSWEEGVKRGFYCATLEFQIGVVFK